MNPGSRIISAPGRESRSSRSNMQAVHLTPLSSFSKMAESQAVKAKDLNSVGRMTMISISMRVQKEAKHLVLDQQTRG